MYRINSKCCSAVFCNTYSALYAEFKLHCKEREQSKRALAAVSEVQYEHMHTKGSYKYSKIWLIQNYNSKFCNILILVWT
jgi:hypothetical protein